MCQQYIPLQHSLELWLDANQCPKQNIRNTATEKPSSLENQAFQADRTVWGLWRLSCSQGAAHSRSRNEKEVTCRSSQCRAVPGPQRNSANRPKWLGRFRRKCGGTHLYWYWCCIDSQVKYALCFCNLLAVMQQRQSYRLFWQPGTLWHVPPYYHRSGVQQFINIVCQHCLEWVGWSFQGPVRSNHPNNTL